MRAECPALCLFVCVLWKNINLCEKSFYFYQQPTTGKQVHVILNQSIINRLISVI